MSRHASNADHRKLHAGENGELKQLLTYREAAEILGVAKRTVWTLVQTGAVPAVRFGRSVRIDPQDLARFISAAKKGGGR